MAPRFVKNVVQVRMADKATSISMHLCPRN